MRLQYIPITVAFLVGATTTTFAQSPRDANAAVASSPSSPRVINRLEIPAEAIAPSATSPSAVSPPVVAPPVVMLPTTPPLVPRPSAAASEPGVATSPAGPADARPEPAPTGTTSLDTTKAVATKVQKSPVAKVEPKSKWAAVKPVTLMVQVDLTSQRAHVRINGAPSHSWPISSGKAGHETPTGSFRPQWMAKSWFSRTYDDAPMPHSVFFNSGIAFHGTTSVRLLGRPASRGCIRLAPKNAEILYGLVQRHGMTSTRISVVGRTPAPVAVASSSSSRQRRSSATAATRRPHPMATASRRVYGLQHYTHTQRPYFGGYYGAYAVHPRHRAPVYGQQRIHRPRDRYVVRRPVQRPVQSWGWAQAGRPSPYWRY